MFPLKTYCAEYVKMPLQQEHFKRIKQDTRIYFILDIDDCGLTLGLLSFTSNMFFRLIM